MKTRGLLTVLAIGVLALAGLSGCSKETASVSEEAKSYEHNFDVARAEVRIDSNAVNKIEDNAGLEVANPAQEAEKAAYVKVIATSLNIRSGPSTDHEILGTVRMGTEFPLISEGSEWTKIVYNGTEAYVYAPYVQIIGESSSASTASGGNGVTYSRDYSYSHLTVVSVDEPYSYERLSEDIEKLSEKYGSKLTAKPIATTADNRFIYELIIGKSGASKTVMIYAGMNGSEWMTSLLLMKQVEHYLNRYDEYKEMFENVSFRIYPMINPDGVTLSVLGETGISTQDFRESARSRYSRDIALKRTTLGKPDYFANWDSNLRGVDIYYNFDYNFDSFAGDVIPGASGYKGQNALSEEESSAIVRQLKKENPNTVIGYFEGEKGIYWNFDQTGHIYDKCLGLYGDIQAVTGYDGATPENANAGFDAYVINNRDIPSVRIEMSGDDGKLDNDDFDSVWKEIRDIWEIFK